MFSLFRCNETTGYLQIGLNFLWMKAAVIQLKITHFPAKLSFILRCYGVAKGF